MCLTNERAAVSGCRRCWAARGMSVGAAVVGWRGVAVRSRFADTLCFAYLPRSLGPTSREGRPVSHRGSVCAPGRGAKGVPVRCPLAAPGAAACRGTSARGAPESALCQKSTSSGLPSLWLTPV